AGPHIPVPVPGPALRPGRLPGHAGTGGRGRHRGMTRRGARRGPPGRPGRRAPPPLRVPPAVMRAGARQLGRRCLDPALPWRVQRTRLDQLTRPFLRPRGTTVTERRIGGVPVEVVSAPAEGTAPSSPATVVHFHGGGYCIG